MRINVLGVPISFVTEEQAVDITTNFLRSQTSHMVFTPNPEMVVLAQKRPEFKKILQNSDLTIADGVGLLYAAQLFGHRLPERVTGVDMVSRICFVAAELNAPVYFLGGKEGVAKRAAEKLIKLYPRLKICGAESGGEVRYADKKDFNQPPTISREVLEKIKEKHPAVLFVAFGHPKQEEWIAAHLTNLPSVRLAMGIGGAFDFIAGDVKRAPKIMRRLGIEWFWRLILQPQRIKRIVTATVVFSYLVLKERLGMIIKG